MYHTLPTGAQPVPLDNVSGERIFDGWKFNYDGTYESSMSHCKRTAQEGEDINDIFP